MTLPTDGSTDRFCLKWFDFQANISSSFEHMWKEKDFSDVTLVCDGDQKIEAHKVILAGASKFFSKLLKHNLHPHPLIYMRGVRPSQLENVVDFIYQGEVNIFQKDLETFLLLAQELQLKGLNGSAANPKQLQVKEEDNQCPALTDEKQASQTDPLVKVHSLGKNKDISDKENKVIIDTTNNDLDNTISSLIEDLGRGNGFICNVCQKKLVSKRDMKDHVEAKHFKDVMHSCKQCIKSFRCRRTLANHIFRFHKTKDIQGMKQSSETIPLEEIIGPDNKARIDTNYQDLDTTISIMVEDLGKANGFMCKVCKKKLDVQRDMRDHVEAKHIEGVSHFCNQCGKSFRCRSTLAHHIVKVHKSSQLMASQTPNLKVL